MASAQGAVAGWKLGASFPSSKSQCVRPGMKLVVPRPSLSLRSCSISMGSSSSVGSSFERSWRWSKLVGLQVTACASSPVNQIGLNNVHGDVATSAGSGPDAAADSAVEEENDTAKIPKETTIPSPSPATASISSFMADVANLVKLVDSRDIVELEMKHKDYEIVIRKKEALAPPPPPPSSFPGPHVMAYTSYPEYPAPAPAPAAGEAAETPAAALSEAPAVSPNSQYPPMLSPMAGTFYRSPAPGEPAFVHVGDRVTKGQVLCIVEAMKLMNEIEADQSGTIVEIVAEDGKPVSIESPLYIIKP